MPKWNKHAKPRQYKREKKATDYLQQQAFRRLGQMLADTTGKKLELGQLVDIQMIGMFRGQVVEINENTIARPGQGPMTPHILVQVFIPKFIEGPTPVLKQIYIVADAPKPESKSTGIIEPGEGKPS